MIYDYEGFEIIMLAPKIFAVESKTFGDLGWPYEKNARLAMNKIDLYNKGESV